MLANNYASNEKANFGSVKMNGKKKNELLEAYFNNSADLQNDSSTVQLRDINNSYDNTPNK